MLVIMLFVCLLSPAMNVCPVTFVVQVLQVTMTAKQWQKVGEYFQVRRQIRIGAAGQGGFFCRPYPIILS